MNCSEFADWTSLYLSGEMEPAHRSGFTAHLATCPACSCALESAVASDNQVLRAVLAERIESGEVVATTSRAIARHRTRRWLGIAAAALLTVSGIGYYTHARLQPSTLLASAAKDHRIEVTQGSPRRWRTALPGVRPLLNQYGVAWSDVETLLPIGFVLEMARQCGIDGEPTLHLVFNDGTRTLSVYVRRPGSSFSASQTRADGAEAASFHRGSLSGIVVATAPGLCAEATRRLTAL